jgi:biotin synthase
MKTISTNYLIENSASDAGLPADDALRVLDPKATDLLTCLGAAHFFRAKYFRNEVLVHILNNVQNGLCPEDCRYCAQSKSSSAAIENYPMKPEDEILAEAKAACDKGAHCYCMVFSGTGPSAERVNKLAAIIRQIKTNHNIEVCVSTGIVNPDQARQLKAAGLDRLNHNLNTSERNYQNICTTHTYQDRIDTLRAAKGAGLSVCSGVIIGMGETDHDIIEVAARLREFKAESIPVNFFIPIPGADIKATSGLTPEYCLRVLCLFRLLNPSAEIRMAAGRELHLRSMEVMGLYAANSLFLQGYLNARGAEDMRTLQLISDAGFIIKTDAAEGAIDPQTASGIDAGSLKTVNELRPFRQVKKTTAL